MKLKFLYIISFLIAIVACKNEDEFKTTETGLKYKIHNETGSPKATVGSLIDLELRCTDENDSVVFDSKKVKSTVKLSLSEPTFIGSLEEGFAMLGVGDSATFIVPADSFYEKTSLEPLPPSIRSGSLLKFDVKVVNIQSRDDYEQKQRSENEIRKNSEEPDIKNYLVTNKITVAPTNTGLYFIQQKEGTGKKATPGSKVSVHYKGTFLNGEKFDSSYDRGEPLEFPLGAGRVIPGWEEGITMMREGGKAQLIIPSHLAYGDRGYGSLIPSYTPLVFEVELISVK